MQGNSNKPKNLFCTPGFGLFGSVIDLGVDLAPVRDRIQACKRRYHKELWDIICDRGIHGSDGNVSKAGEEPPAEEGGEEANQSNAPGRTVDSSASNSTSKGGSGLSNLSCGSMTLPLTSSTNSAAMMASTLPAEPARFKPPPQMMMQQPAVATQQQQQIGQIKTKTMFTSALPVEPARFPPPPQMMMQQPAVATQQQQQQTGQINTTTMFTSALPVEPARFPPPPQMVMQQPAVAPQQLQQIGQMNPKTILKPQLMSHPQQQVYFDLQSMSQAHSQCLPPIGEQPLYPQPVVPLPQNTDVIQQTYGFTPARPTDEAIMSAGHPVNPRLAYINRAKATIGGCNLAGFSSTSSSSNSSNSPKSASPPAVQANSAHFVPMRCGDWTKAGLSSFKKASSSKKLLGKRVVSKAKLQ